MTFTVTINMDNAAFEEDGQAGANEVARILKRLASQVQSSGFIHTLRDINGNEVGESSAETD